MKLRELLCCLGLILSMLFLTSPAFAADKSVCSMECDKCATACTKVLSYCKSQSGKHDYTAHIKTLGDCIQMCKTSQDFMKRGSDETAKVCGLCRDMCIKCADSCDQTKDPKMKDCAAECRKCADHCKEMAG